MCITLCNTPKNPELCTFTYLVKKLKQRESEQHAHGHSVLNHH